MVTISKNSEKGGIELSFPSKPADEVLIWIKSKGFGWSRYNKVWWRKFSDKIWVDVHEYFDQPVAAISDNIDIPEPEPVRDIPKALKNKIIHLLGMQRNKHTGVSNGGMDINLFKSNLFGRIKTIHKNGNQALVNMALSYLDEKNSELNIPAVFTPRHAIWKLMTEKVNIEKPVIVNTEKKERPSAFIQNNTQFNTIIDRIQEKHGGKRFDISEQFDLGRKVEEEHTSDSTEAIRIAYDHLWEDPKYYTKAKPANWAEKEIEKEQGIKKIESDQAVQEVNQELLDEQVPGTIRPDFITGPVLKGREIQISMPNGEKRSSIFAIVELDNITASHNEENFHSEPDYPKNASGNNINDRNYKDDLSAQKAVMDYARELEPERLITTSRTPSGTPIITKDGFVVSGNNRTMSLKLAAKEYKGNYRLYMQYLLEEIESFGFERGSFYEDKLIATDKNDKTIHFIRPVLVRIDLDFKEYTTQELAKYNKDTKKSERPVDKAIKISNILRENSRCAEIIADITGEYDTFSEFYANIAGQKKLAKTLIECNLLTEQELPAYFSDTTFTESGKEFIENLLAALILDRDALMAAEQPGVRATRQKLITSLPVLMKNASLPEGSLKKNINDAIILQQVIKSSGSEFTDFIRQQNLFGTTYNRETVYINRLIDSGKLKFKQAIEGYNDAIVKNQGASLFGDKPSTEQVFDHWIKGNVSEIDQRLIEASKIVGKEEFKLSPEQIEKIKPEWDKMQNFLKDPEEKQPDIMEKELHPYIAFYKDKQHELYAESLYAAQLQAANFFNVPMNKSWKVNVKLAVESKVDTKKLEADELAKNLQILRKIISSDQIEALMTLIRSEEREAGIDIVNSLVNTFQTMPHTYQTEGTATDDKIVYLHYFNGGSDWYIIEKDKEVAQLQAFGYTILNGDMQNAEWGYISIVELIQNNIELDFYWTPKKFSEIIEKKERIRSTGPGARLMKYWDEQKGAIMAGLPPELKIVKDINGASRLFAQTMDGVNVGVIELDPIDIHSYSPAYKEYLDQVVLRLDFFKNKEELIERGEIQSRSDFLDDLRPIDMWQEFEEREYRSFLLKPDTARNVMDLGIKESVRDHKIDGKDYIDTVISIPLGSESLKEEIEAAYQENTGIKVTSNEPESKYKVGDTVTAFWDKKGISSSATKDEKHNIQRTGEIEKVTWQPERQKYSYTVKHATGFFLAEDDILKLYGSTEPEEKEIKKVILPDDIHRLIAFLNATDDPKRKAEMWNEGWEDEKNHTGTIASRSRLLPQLGRTLWQIAILNPNFTEVANHGDEEKIFWRGEDLKASIVKIYKKEGMEPVFTSFEHKEPEKTGLSGINEINSIDTDSYDYWFERYSAWGKSEVEEVYNKYYKEHASDPDFLKSANNRFKALVDVAKKKGIITLIKGEKESKPETSSLNPSDYPDEYKLNKGIEKLLDDKWNDPAGSWSEEQLNFIKGYTGYGGLDKFGKITTGSLFEYFTPDLVIEKMWGLAYKYGYKDGPVLEPSVGIGAFFDRRFVSNLIQKFGYEVNKYSAKITKLLFPEAIINDGEEVKYFEQLFIQKNYTVRNKVTPKYKLVIGNPPYGTVGGIYMGMGEKSYTKANNYIDYFILRGLDLLEKDGLLIYIVGAETAGGGVPFLDQGMNKIKEMISERGKLIDAYRLPSGIFARTDVTSDIIVFRKR